MNKAKITFHFDHSGNRVGEKDHRKSGENKVIPLKPENSQTKDDTPDQVGINQFTTDFGPWQSEFEADTDRVEQVIHHIEMKTNASKVIEINQKENKLKSVNNFKYQEPRIVQSDDRIKIPEEPMWELNRDQIWTEESFNGVMLRKRPRTSWWKAVLSISAAVMTGVTLGFFILNIIQGGGEVLDPSKSAMVTPAPESSKPTAEGKTPAQEKDVTSQAVTAGVSMEGMINVNIDSYTYSFLQHGVFSSAETGQAAITELGRKGFVTSTEQGDKLTVYAGVAANKADAQRLAEVLKGSQIDIYVKSIAIPAISQMKWSGSKPQSVRDYITNGDKLIRMISGVTVTHLEETQSTPFDPATMASIKDAHTGWTSIATALKDGQDEANKIILSMTKSMNAAILSLEEYEQKPSSSLLWKAQSAMMQYLIAEKQLYKAINAI